MSRIIMFLLTFLLLLSDVSSQTNYLNESKAAKDTRMNWWRDAGFGMFIHWGLYALPAGEWDGNTNHAEWIRTTAQIPLETYNKFLSQFNPTNFDAEKWVLTAKNSGMKYIVITSKHHDGFCLFDSKYTDYDVMSTPFKRDILKELSDAADKYGIKLGFYYSIMDWHHEDYLPRRDWEKTRSSEGADFNRYIQYMKNQLKELVTNYNIGILWFDGEWEETWKHEYGVDLYNYVRNLQPDIIINNRVDVGRSGMAGMTKEGYIGDFGTPEQEIPENGFPGIDWESCMTLNDHWGYNKSDKNWKSPEEVVKILSDISSKGGNLLLNVGPKADGEFPQESIDILKDVGNWLKVNAEAIFLTEPCRLQTPEHVECTQKKSSENTKLYFTIIDWPFDSKITISGLLNEPDRAYLLSDVNESALPVVRHEDGIVISLHEVKPDFNNNVIVLEFAGEPDIIVPPTIRTKNEIFIDSNKVELISDRENLEIRYTLDGTLPNFASTLYTHPINLYNSAKLTVRCFMGNRPVSGINSMDFIKVVRVEDVLLLSNPSPKYPAEHGGHSLVDGVLGDDDFNDPAWMGFEGEDFEAVLDFGNSKSIQQVSIRCLENIESWIFLPNKIEISVSDSPEDFQPITIVTESEIKSPKKGKTILIQKRLDNIDSRYMKIRASNIKECPAGHPGEGGKAWVFIDEIIIE